MTDYTKEAISWARITDDTKAFSIQIKDQIDVTNLKGIIAIARGGLSVAQLMAYYLDIRRIETLSVIGYNDMQKIDQHMRGTPSPDIGDGAGWLVIDDLVDTGGTYKFLRDKLPQAQFAALYYKPAGKDQADMSLSGFDQDVWVDFPWEVEPLVS